ncbi:MAG: ribonuclease H-like domain-containing protein [Clostridia bacterium]|nr:ribonuclease H-like domain-containing protein [Clostridia bacterium]
MDNSFGGALVENSYGSCLLIEKDITTIGPRKGDGDPIAAIARNLQLVYGIGPITESRLRDEGYATIFDLVQHERWADRARLVVEALENADGRALSSCGVPDMELLTMCSPEEVVFLDIETCGLPSTAALFMVGLLLPGKEGFRLCQLFASEYDDEPAVLDEAMARLACARAIITYNGKSFDIPFIRRRLAYHGQDDRIAACIVDLCHPARRRYRNHLPNCRLSTIEDLILDHPRVDDVPGSLIPQMYAQFVRTGDWDIISPVVFHNELDLLAMASLLPLLA